MSNSNKNQMFLAFFMWFLTVAFYVCVYMVKLSPAAMAMDLVNSLHFSMENFKQLSGVFYYVSLVMLIPAGMLLDRFNVRYVFAIALTCCAVGAIIFSQANSYVVIVFACGLVAFGSAFMLLGSFKIISNWFSANKFAFFAGLTFAVGILSAAFESSFLVRMVSALGWRGNLLTLGVVCGVFALMALLFLRNQPANMITKGPKQRKPVKSLEGLFFVLANAKTWILICYSVLINASVLTFVLLWGPSFLHQVYSMQLVVAGESTAMFFLGLAVGFPLTAWVSDKVNVRRPLMYIGSLGALVTISAILYIPGGSVLLLTILFFCLGLFAGGSLISLAIIREVHPHRYGATALGLILFFMTLAAYFMRFIVSMFFAFVSSGQFPNAMSVYSISDYQIALTVLPVMIGLSVFLIPFLRETHCVPMDTREESFGTEA